MQPVRHLLAAVLMTTQLVAQGPRQVVRTAILAVEGDSARVVTDRWSARLARDSTDRESLLGLAAVAQSTYRFDLARLLTARLLLPAETAPNAWSVYATLLEARGLAAQSRFAAADSLFAITAEQAHRLGDHAAEAEALLGRAVTQVRIVGPAGVAVTLQRARPLIPASDTAFEAAWRCSHAALLSLTDPPAAAGEARAGASLAEAGHQARIALTCRFATARLLLNAGKSFPAADSLALIAAAFASIHDIAEQASSLQWAGYALGGVGQYGAARGAALAAVEAGRASGNLSAVAWADLNLTGIAYLFGDVETAAHPLAEAESLFVQQGDNWGFAALQGYKAGLAESEGNLERARTIYQAALDRLAGFDPDGALQFRVQLASIARRERDYPTAARELAAAHRIARTNGMRGWQEALAFSDGILALARGDLATAESDLREHLRTLGSGQPARRYVAEARLAGTGRALTPGEQRRFLHR
jgi:hypothetical protein